MKNLTHYLVIMVLSALALTGCTAKKDEEDKAAKQYYYDPKIPFGQIGDGRTTVVKNVMNLTADTSVVNKIKLTWTVPPIYTTLGYQVFIYRVQEPASDFNILCPKPEGNLFSTCPADEVTNAPLYLHGQVQGTQFVDQDEVVDGETVYNVESNTPYTYWVFLRVNDNDWSSGVRLDVVSKSNGSDFALPDPAKFWESKQWTYGTASTGNVQFLQSMNAGDALPGDPRGGISLGSDGNVMYYADTNNNRVVVYKRAGAVDCDVYTDPFDKQACLFQYAGSPLSASNILGQSQQTSRLACGEPGALPANECLTAPTRTTVIGNKLFISDSGNNRIVVYNHLPLNGCITDNGLGNLTPRDCTPNAVIGKAGLLDLTSYSLESRGKSILSNPTDIAEKDGDLYIADTGHNRVVRIDNFNSLNSFSCTPDTWTTSLCEFSAVLGQPSYYTKTTFKDLYTADNTIVQQTGLFNTLDIHRDKVLKRYFANPTRIKFTANGKMLIGSNELFAIPNPLGTRSSLQGRIMIFDANIIADQTSICNEATFDAGNCDAEGVIGQAEFNKLETVSGATSAAYNQLEHTMYSVDDFDIITLPAADENTTPKQALLAVNSVDNLVYLFNDWTNKSGDKYVKSFSIQDPEGAMSTSNPNTSLPDLKSLCAIRIEENTASIYITDCGGNHVYQINSRNTN